MRGRTPVSALKAIASSESIELPLGHPAIVFPLRRPNAETWSGSNGAATISNLPRALRPSAVLAIAEA